MALRLLPRFFKFLTLRRVWELLGVFALMVATSVAEITTLGAIIPFLTVLSNPSALWGNSLIRSTAAHYGIISPQGLVLPITLIFILIVFISSLVRYANLWASVHVAASVGSDLSAAAYQKVLLQPYQTYLQQNSSDILTILTTQIGRTVAAFNAFLLLSNAGFVALSLLLGLLVIDWRVATAATIIFSFLYICIAFNNKKKLRENSEKISQKSRRLLRALNEGLGSKREIILGNLHNVYLPEFSISDRERRFIQANNQFIQGYPKFLIEFFGLSFIGLISYITYSTSNASSNLIPLLGSFALAAQRLLPALQQIYLGWSRLNSYTSDMNNVLNLLESPQSFEQARVTDKCYILRDSIVFSQVNFRYTDDSPAVIHDLNLKINPHEIIGIVGKTGSGKSTFVDLFTTLLAPSSGQILLDGQPFIYSNPNMLQQWRNSIAHVPQSVYLADISISRNIALGERQTNISTVDVIEAAEAACISSYIQSLPASYDTPVGERGIQLSGGQRQRIGIARALYKKRPILILDEATSALDDQTEKEVIKNILEYSSTKLLIMIAHRQSTLFNCTRIIQIKDGQIAYDDSSSKYFADS